MIADQDSTGLDDLLRLPANASTSHRARAVANVLWPWGDTAQADLSYNPYSRTLRASIAMLRPFVNLRPPNRIIVPWDNDQRDAVHDLLRDSGEAILSVPVTDRATLQTAILDLQTRPIEVGTLLCHPVVVGARTTDQHAEVRVLLREAV